MTLQETIKQRLIDNGVWEDEAVAIIEQAKTDKVLQHLQNRWNDDIEGYPVQLLVATWYAVKRVAIEWLQVQSPKHFALWMLQDETA